MRDKFVAAVREKWISKFTSADDAGKLAVWAEMIETFSRANTLAENWNLITEIHRLFQSDFARSVDVNLYNEKELHRIFNKNRLTKK